MKFPYYPFKSSFPFPPNLHYRPPLPPRANIKHPISFNTCNTSSKSTNDIISSNFHSSNESNSYETTISKEENLAEVSLRNSNCKSNCDNDFEKFFSIWGFDLYLDDLIILALLFFLYKEEVDDPYLYISLILLLLS